MKIIIAKNKISTSLKSKLKEVTEWFSPIFDLEFTEEKIKLDITYGGYYFIDIDGSTKYFQAVDETWYDQNISIPYQKQGYEISILLLKNSDWNGSIYDSNGNYVSGRTVGGFGNMENDCGIEEVALPYDTSGNYNFNGVELEGNKFVWTLIHELLHRFYEMKGLTDNTHKYFLFGTPEKCLEALKQPIMTTIYKPTNFKITELVPKEIYEKYGEQAWQFIDSRLLKNLQFMREKLGRAILVNNYSKGLENRCFDPKKAYGGSREGCSQHTMGRGVDGTVSGMTTEQVHTWIKEHYKEFPEPCITLENLEDTPTWFHMDVRYRDYDGSILFVSGN